MAAFQFRLGRLSRVRDIQERNARNLWAAAEEVARNHQEVVDFNREEIRKAGRELARIQAEEAMEIHDVLSAQDLIERLEARLRIARERAQTSRFQADQLKESWLAAKSEARALEKLEDRARNEHALEERKLESAAMDEIAMARSIPAGPRGPLQKEDSN